MSADNGLIISKTKCKKKTIYIVREYNASTGYLFPLGGQYKTLDEACKAAQKYMKEEIVEYGVTFKI